MFIEGRADIIYSECGSAIVEKSLMMMTTTTTLSEKRPCESFSPLLSFSTMGRAFCLCAFKVYKV
jgi:hypothetical protein